MVNSLFVKLDGYFIVLSLHNGEISLYLICKISMLTVSLAKQSHFILRLIAD
jgi:hypothetical protein